jgi:selenocysteine lyase/cysteine desulfurase
MGATGEQCELTLQPTERPRCFEPGIPNTPAFAGLAAALRWGEEHGEEYRPRGADQAETLRAGLKRIRGVQLFDTAKRAQRIPLLSFRLDGWKLAEVGQALAAEYGIYCRAGLHCAPLIHKAIGSKPEGTIRFSLSGVNTEEEVQTALKAVRELAARTRAARVPAIRLSRERIKI